jgi:copper(I)-binding protein
MILVRILLPLLLALVPVAAGAQQYRLGSITVEQPWSRATPPGARVAAGYMTITNNGATPDRLVAATFAVAPRVEFHETSTENGVVKMRELPNGIPIPPRSTIELKPGALHLMFREPTRPLVRGEEVTGTLTFEKAGTIEIRYKVVAVGASPAQPGRGAHQH